MDIFFVISGFLITSLILKDLNRGAFSLAHFWERRVRRIFPALAAVTAATLVAAWFLLLPPAFKDLGESTTSLVLLISNIHFWRATDYFGRAAQELPLLHTWSLAVEEQFYLLLPLGLVGLAKIKRIGSAAIVLAAIAALSFAVAVYQVDQARDAAFYLLPSRIWELMIGSLLSMAPPLRSKSVREGIGWLSLPLMLAPAFLYRQNTPFPGFAAVPPVLGAGLVIWAGMGRELPLVNRMLASRPAVFVGLISYSLYLWHWPLLAIHRAAFPGEASLKERVLLAAFSIGLAVLSWKFVETPFRVGKVVPTRGRLFALAGAFAVALLGAGLAIDRTGGFRFRLPAESWAFLESGRSEPRFMRKIPADQVVNSLTPLGIPGEPKLLVWGDSHAMSLLPAVDELCKENGISARAATYSTNRPVLDYPRNAKRELKQFNEAVFSLIRSRKFPHVMLVGRWDRETKDKDFPAALVKTVERVVALGCQVYIVTDVPDYRCNVPEALALFTWRGQQPGRIKKFRNDYQRENGPYLKLLPAFREKGAMVLDAGAALDAAGKGLPFDETGSFYMDDHHLSIHGALAASPALKPMIERIRANH